jgi:hypothetical protein
MNTGTYLHFTIENPYTGQTITLNDVTTDPAKYYTINESPESLLGIRTSKVNRLGRHFVKTDYSFYGEREITLRGQIVVTNGNVDDMEDLVADLRKIFALPPLPNENNDGFVTLKWTDERGLDWYMEVKLIADIRIESIFNMPYVRNYEIRLLAEDGLIYSQSISSASQPTSYFGGTLKLPTLLPAVLDEEWWNVMTVNNQGNFPSPQILIIYGYTENPKITHVASGSFIHLDGYTLADGRYLTIDVSEGTIELDDGTDLSAYLSTDSVWFYLEPGSNELRLTHDGSYLLGSFECQFRNTEI